MAVLLVWSWAMQTGALFQSMLKVAPHVVPRPVPLVVILRALSVPTIVAALPQPPVSDPGAVPWCSVWPATTRVALGEVVPMPTEPPLGLRISG